MDNVFAAYDLVASMDIEGLPFRPEALQQKLLEDATLGLGVERVAGTFR